MQRLILALFAVTTLLGCAGESATSTPTADNPRAPQAREEAATNDARARRSAARADARRGAILRERLTMKDYGTREVPAIAVSELPEGAPHLVALVILDTLRADRTSLCGHDKPNTPVLEALAKTATSWTCDAYSPATWTLPAHASLFTGDTTAAHGVHTLGTPLADSYETFAETYMNRLRMWTAFLFAAIIPGLSVLPLLPRGLKAWCGSDRRSRRHHDRRRTAAEVEKDRGSAKDTASRLAAAERAAASLRERVSGTMRLLAWALLVFGFARRGDPFRRGRTREHIFFFSLTLSSVHPKSKCSELMSYPVQRDSDCGDGCAYPCNPGLAPTARVFFFCLALRSASGVRCHELSRAAPA